MTTYKRQEIIGYVIRKESNWKIKTQQFSIKALNQHQLFPIELEKNIKIC